MVQKVLPKGPRVLPPKCDFQKMRLGECYVHILRGPWIEPQGIAVMGSVMDFFTTVTDPITAMGVAHIVGHGIVDLGSKILKR